MYGMSAAAQAWVYGLESPVLGAARKDRECRPAQSRDARGVSMPVSLATCANRNSEI
jgi:hypothetical protein